MKQVEFLHTVLFWLKNPEKKEDCILFETSLNTFLKNSKFIETHYIGIPANTNRAIVDNSYTYSLTVGFLSKQNHDLYQDETAHQLFIEECKHLWDRILIYDAQKI